jgi:hypothetical protein
VRAWRSDLLDVPATQHTSCGESSRPSFHGHSELPEPLRFDPANRDRNYTQALYDARVLVMQRMQSEAQELKAEGIVGVSLSASHGWGSHVTEFFALGTAILPTGARTEIGPPIPVLDLNDP